MVSREVEGTSITSRARSSSNDCDTLALQGQSKPSVGILPSAAGVSIQDGNVVGICGDSITAGRDVHYHQHHCSSSRSPFHPTNENQEPQRADTSSMQPHRRISSEYTPTPTRPIQRSYDIYKRHLEAKRHGKCLWIPAPSKNLPIQYQRNGIAIGDVGIVHPSGRFIFLFNFCLPKDHPFHPSKMPAGFEPLPSDVIQEFIISEQREFSENSFLASESTVRVTTDGGSTGLVFESSNQDGAILTMPIGAKSEDLENVVLFRKYVLANLASWYRYAYHDRSLDVRNGDLRVVTGSDKTSAWGMATFSHSKGHSSTGQGSAFGVPGSEPKFHLQFGPIANGNVASHRTPKRYVWEYSGAAEVRTGPDATEIAKLRGNDGDDDDDDDGVVYENQCLFIRTLNPTLSKRLWEGLGIEEEDDEVDFGCGDGSHSMSGSTSGSSSSPAGQGGNASNGSQLNQGGSFSPAGSHNQAVISTSFGTGNVGPYRCTTPDHSSSITLADHPSNAINQFLLNNCSGDIAMAVTVDQDWIAVLTKDDNVLPSSQELLERIREAYDICEEDDIVFLSLKGQTLNRTSGNFSSIVNDNISEARSEEPAISFENVDLDVLAYKTPHLSTSVSDHTSGNDERPDFFPSHPLGQTPALMYPSPHPEDATMDAKFHSTKSCESLVSPAVMAATMVKEYHFIDRAATQSATSGCISKMLGTDVIPTAPNLEDIVSSTRNLLTIVEAHWGTQDQATTQSVATTEGRQQVRKFAEAFNDSLDAAQKGFTAASEGLTLAELCVGDAKANKSEKEKYMEEMEELSKAGLERSKKALDGFRDVKKRISEALKQMKPHQENGAHDTERQVLDQSLSVLGEFEKLMVWYVHWWTEKNMEENSQQSRIGAQAQKPTDIGISIVAKKWQTLKDGYSSYTEKMQEIQDVLKGVYWATPEHIKDKRRTSDVAGLVAQELPTSGPPILRGHRGTVPFFQNSIGVTLNTSNFYVVHGDLYVGPSPELFYQGDALRTASEGTLYPESSQLNYGPIVNTERIPGGEITSNLASELSMTETIADKELLVLRRPHKPGNALCKLIQAEIRYGVDEEAPYCVMAFRFQGGEDEKRFSALKLTGEFVGSGSNEDVKVQEIRYMYEGVHISQAKVPGQSEAGRSASQMTSSRLPLGQTFRYSFGVAEATFNVTLSVDRQVANHLSDIDRTQFSLLLRLKEQCQPIKLKATLEVIYRRKRRLTNKTITGSFEVDYPESELYHRRP